MPIKNLASGTLAESVSASTTTLLVYVGEGGATTIRNVWPAPPFYASIMPANPSAGVANSLDSEIVKVTAVGNDQVGNTALSVVRAQRGTTSKAFTAGAIVTNANYAEDAVLLGDEGSTEAHTPWIGVADIIWSQMVDKIYPVGSIFMSATLSTATAVGNALGGTWEEWGTGKVPVGVDTSQTEFNSVEKTGGSKYLQQHTHSYKGIPMDETSGWSDPYNRIAYKNTSNNPYPTTGGAVNSAGSGNSGNLQPYITCYMYKRIA